MSAAELVAENISWAPRGPDPLLLHPTSFRVEAGRVLGVVGPNGAGKSTLLRLIYRYQRPSTGHIFVAGEDIWAVPPRMAARRVAAVLQEHTSLFGLTVREVVALGRTPHHGGFWSAGARDASIIEAAITQLNLEAFADRDLATLSGGERQRVMVARALAQEPQVLVLDEPTNHLDVRHQLEVLALIRQLDLTIIVSLHDLNMAADICDTILLLDRGHTRAFGPPDLALTEALVSTTFRVDARAERLAPSNTQHFSFHLPD
ncbi:ABC transporter ATP-binding protein [uncultured Roseobacter sp.]|uniref:ABC transporter ATP-binding protein n=1 Tax=uncultured Roseobacter sp. TaxID=114847 RepID=UPI00262F6603|nr:ABC transporter ATP-binding protein [uncultured Roseobacter sp.]